MREKYKFLINILHRVHDNSIVCGNVQDRQPSLEIGVCCIFAFGNKTTLINLFRAGKTTKSDREM